MQSATVKQMANAGVAKWLWARFSKAIVEKLPPGHWLWDADHREVVKGFGARRQVDGVFYYLRYRLHGRQRIKSIGRHGSPFTPDTARTEAKCMLGLVANNVDPHDEETRIQLPSA